VQRVSGLGSVVHDLEFSPNGRYLAAMIGDGWGIRIYRISNNQAILETELTDYEESVINAAFSNDGSLFASVSLSGVLRLYDHAFNLIRQTNTTSGKMAISVAFSPDRESIAVGYNDSPQIQVFDTNTLHVKYEPEMGEANTTGKRMEMVTFSPDGRYLYAGSFYAKKADDGRTWRHIRQYDQGGRGDYLDFPASSNTINDIRCLPDGDVIYAGLGPDFGRFKPSGEWTFYKKAAIHRLSKGDRTHLRVNENGGEVGFKPLYEDSMTFSLNARILFQAESNHPSYIDSAGGMIISDWNSRVPKINDLPITFMHNYESFRCADIASSAEKAVLGSDWTLYCADAAGNMIWKTPTEHSVWSVNIAGDEKIVVAAFGNGTLNWYRMTDGEHLMTLFIHPETNGWILYSKSGYYDAAPGAEDLIGWHINNGADHEASFYPASRFRSKYYRPDVIDLILETLDEEEAVRRANETGRRIVTTDITDMLPPVIRIINPKSGAEVSGNSIQVQYRAESPDSDAAVEAVKVLVDGRAAETQRGIKVVGDHMLSVAIPSKDCRISLIAESRHGFSDPAHVDLVWKGADPAELLKPNLYVLAIGVSEYANPDLKLAFAAKDARDFSAAVEAQEGLLYRSVEVKLLVDGEATKDNILDGLEWLGNEVTHRDVAMLYIAGHGINDQNGTFFFLPVEANLDRIRRSCLIFTDIEYTVSTVPGKMLVFSDACHSGNIMGDTRRRAPDVNKLVNQLSSAENGAIVFTSSTGRQYSLENPEWGNGAFTKALVEGLQGKADLFETGKITIKTLDAYVAERVKALTGGKQSPTTIIPQSISDFPIAVKQ